MKDFDHKRHLARAVGGKGFYYSGEMFFAKFAGNQRCISTSLPTHLQSWKEEEEEKKNLREVVAKETASKVLCWSAKAVRVMESVYVCVCVCDVWSPRATNGAGESRGHYVEAVRALETLPSISLSFPL